MSTGMEAGVRGVKGPPNPGPPAAGTVAFIVGCGRSGTTILGTVLSHHEDVSYVNDCFDLWIRPFGVADIWGRRVDAERHRPRVELSAGDVPESGRERFYELLELERRGKRLIVEKLAINNFRIGFLLELCPGASIISIVRHGAEVAWSIEAKAAKGQWYGRSDAKWNHLVEHAKSNGYADVLALCRTNWDRALLEWRMSVEAAERYMSEHPPARLLRLRYEELIADPVSVCGRMERFLGLRHSEAMERFAAEQVRRQSPPASLRPGGVPASARAIAGETLERLGYSI